jgi:hypothetical protein
VHLGGSYGSVGLAVTSQRTAQSESARGHWLATLGTSVNQLTVGAGIQTFCDGHHNLIEGVSTRSMNTSPLAGSG